MVSLTPREFLEVRAAESTRRKLLRSMGTVLAALCLCASFAVAEQQDPKAAVAPTAPSLDAARQAYSDLELESAEALARAFLEDAPAEPADESLRRLRAEAWDIVAQCRFHAGDEAGRSAAIAEAIGEDPDYLPDDRLAGPKYAALYAGQRDELTGMIEVTCRPVPCDFITIAGRPLDSTAFERGRRGPLRAAVGTMTVRAGARNFAEAQREAVEVKAGEVSSVEIDLEQVARDLTFSVEPPSAVASLVRENQAGESLQGEVLGARSGQDASARMMLPGLAPGRYVLTLVAPCRRRIEQSVQITIDELDPGPLDLGSFVMEEAKATIEVVWTRPEGVLVLDARPVEAGSLTVCPGTHDLSLEVGGRRVWFEKVEVAPEENRRLVAVPRPSLALIGPTEDLASLFDEKEWNLAEISDAAGKALEKVLTTALAPMENDLASFPEIRRFDQERLAAAVKASVPGADLLLALVDGRGRLARSRTLAVVDARRGLVEVTRWPRQRSELAAEIARFFSPDTGKDWPYWGFDLVGRNDPYPVIARIAASGPAAASGLAAGDLITAINGRAASDLFAARRMLLEAEPGATAQVSVLSGGAERTLEVTPAANVSAPLPATLVDGFALPRLAHADLLRLAGEGSERLAGAVRAGLLLAGLGRDEDAAEVLGVAAVDRAIDPSGYARATVAWVLEGLLRRLGEQEWADEIHARAAELDDPRLGGPDGPRLPSAGR